MRLEQQVTNNQGVCLFAAIAHEVKVVVELKVTNTGNIPGSEVVQLYVSYPSASDLTHPPLVLKKFAKLRDVQPGKTVDVSLTLDKYAVSYWEERISSWTIDGGKYQVLVGKSSSDLPLHGAFEVGKGQAFEWNGL